MCVQNKRKGALKFIKLLLQHVCSKQARDCFCNTRKCMFKTSGRILLQQEARVFKTYGRLLFSPPVHQLSVSIILLKYFYYEFYKNFREWCFLNGYSLIYLANYKNFCGRLLFSLFINLSINSSTYLKGCFPSMKEILKKLDISQEEYYNGTSVNYSFQIVYLSLISVLIRAFRLSGPRPATFISGPRPSVRGPIKVLTSSAFS